MIRSLSASKVTHALTILLLLMTGLSSAVARADEPAKNTPPVTGDRAKDFTLSTLTGETVALKTLTSKGPVVLLVLRGYPGYQCPICTVQVGDFLGKADGFAGRKASVVLVYPGPADKLKEHASEFVRGKTLPEHFYFLIDPDYAFTNAYGLRWDAPRETAYPSTFVLDREGTVRFSQVSKTHGGRTKADDVLKKLPAVESESGGR